MKARKDDVRQWHYIKRNTRTCTPTSMLFVDTETDGIKVPDNPNATIQVLRFWVAKHVRCERSGVRGSECYTGTTVDGFWEVVSDLLSERRPLWLFAHNLGFDLTVLRFWDLLENGTYHLGERDWNIATTDGVYSVKGWKGIAVLDDPPTILEARKAGTKCNLICNDTYNYFRQSVESLGKSIGLPKLPMPSIDEPQEKWDEYCRRDVEIVARSVIGLMQFVNAHNLGVWRYTAPAQAMSAYRHRFMNHKILVHGNKDALQLEREAYYGGRLECRFAGKILSDNDLNARYFAGKPEPITPFRLGPVHVLDVNSCYPSVMLWHRYPRAITSLMQMPSIDDLASAVNNHCAIARVEIDTCDEPYPVRHENRTVLAIGRYVTSLCGPELEYALSRRHIKSVGLLAIYDAADLFSEYVSFFWNLRLEAQAAGNEVQETWCKLMLNSLAGKFGQRARKWEESDDVTSPKPWGTWSQVNPSTGQSRSYRSLAWSVQEEQDAGESIDSCPSIAAYITSYARELIRYLMSIAGKDNVYYCDTDSLHVNDDGLVRLMNRNTLGDSGLGLLKRVGTYETAEYRGLKDYTLYGTHHIAGIRAKATEVSSGLFKQHKFQRIASILSGPIPVGVRVDEVTIDRRIGLDPMRIAHNGTVSYQVIGR
jgi:DNA polymerase type B, organellar and viral